VDFKLFNSWQVVLPSPGYVTANQYRRSGEFKCAGRFIIPESTVVGRQKSSLFILLNGPKICAAGNAIAESLC
jgi:hypothetical protein